MKAELPLEDRNDAVLGPVERIVVLRANGVGDFIFALPALAALRARFPHAQVTVLGKRWHREFLSGRSRLIDEVVALPPIAGISAPEGIAVDQAEVDACVEALRAKRFDLAFQLHGGGGNSNPFVARLGARHSFGACAPEALPLDHVVPYERWQNERLRLLEIVALAGATTSQLEPVLPVLGSDRRELAERVVLPDGPLAVLSPGATDPRRRWPVERFAAVGDALAEAGAVVAVQGDESERELTAGVVAAMRHPATNVGGLLSLGGLAALLARAQLLVANDSGPLHLAQAVGTATVGIYWMVNLYASGPPTVARRRYALSMRQDCPVCGQRNLDARCEHDVSFVGDVALEDIMRPALALWQQAPAARAMPAREPALR